MVPALSISRKYHPLIGKLLLIQNPQLAERLITEYQSQFRKPTFQEYTQIECQFAAFCRIIGEDSAQVKGAQYKRAKVDQQRLFVGAIIALYAPHLFQPSERNVLVPKGLGKAISSAIDQDNGNVSRMIQQVITMEKVYKEFRGRLESVVTELINA